MKKTLVGIAAGAVVLLTAGCGAAAYDDRDAGSGAGANADVNGNVDWVAIYKNADGVPTIAFTCVDGMGFFTPASAKSGGESYSAGGTTIQRLPEIDAMCAGKNK